MSPGDTLVLTNESERTRMREFRLHLQREAHRRRTRRANLKRTIAKVLRSCLRIEMRATP